VSRLPGHTAVPVDILFSTAPRQHVQKPHGFKILCFIVTESYYTPRVIAHTRYDIMTGSSGRTSRNRCVEAVAETGGAQCVAG